MLHQTNMFSKDPGRCKELERLERVVSYRVARLHQSLSVQATAILSRFNITLSNWRVLSAVWIERAETSRQLAEKTGFDPAQISRALHSLEKEGLLRLPTNEYDRRILMIELTERGIAMFEEMLPHMKARHDTLRDALTADEMDAFLIMLGKLEAVAVLPRDTILSQAGLSTES